MGIIGVADQTSPGYLQEYTASRGDVFGAAFENAVADNPTTKFLEWRQAKEASGEMVSKEEADQLAQAAGAHIEVPEDGIPRNALNLMVSRAFEKRKREETMAAGRPGFVNGASQLTAGLAGGLLDPLNIAASFIPVVGEERYAAMLANAGGALERAGVRAAVGAAEGAVGAAVIEPANYYLSKQIGDDYTMANSLTNIAFGSVMGGGLHMGIGALGEAIHGFKPIETAEPGGRIPQQLESIPPQARQEMGRLAIAQAMEDRPIEVGFLAHTAVEQRIQADLRKLTHPDTAVDAAVEAIRQVDRRKIPVAMEERLAAARERDPEAFQRLDVINQESRGLEAKAQEIRDRIAQPEAEMAQIDARLAELKTELDAGNHPLSKMQELGSEEMMLQERRAQLEAEMAPHQQELKSVEGGIQDMRFYSKDLSERVSTAFREASRDLKPLKIEAVIEEGQRAVESQPSSRFMDQKVIEEHVQELAELPRDTHVEAAEQLAAEAVDDLKALADQTGHDLTQVQAQMDDILKSAKEYTDAVRAMANCQMRKGS